jgi:hypothetical protein
VSVLVNESLSSSLCRPGLLSCQEKLFTFARWRWRFQITETLTRFVAFVFASLQSCG